jgi:hypothetical protein
MACRELIRTSAAIDESYQCIEQPLPFSRLAINMIPARPTTPCTAKGQGDSKIELDGAAGRMPTGKAAIPIKGCQFAVGFTHPSENSPGHKFNKNVVSLWPTVLFLMA